MAHRSPSKPMCPSLLKPIAGLRVFSKERRFDFVGLLTKWELRLSLTSCAWSLSPGPPQPSQVLPRDYCSDLHRYRPKGWLISDWCCSSSFSFQFIDWLFNLMESPKEGLSVESRGLLKGMTSVLPAHCRWKPPSAVCAVKQHLSGCWFLKGLVLVQLKKKLEAATSVAFGIRKWI